MRVAGYELRGASWQVLSDPRWADATLGEYLAAKGYSSYFRDHYIVPMCAAAWCSEM